MVIGFVIMILSALHFYSQVLYRRQANPVFRLNFIGA